MKTPEEFEQLRTEIRSIARKDGRSLDNKTRHAKSYLVSACTLYVYGETDYYHYPAFYLIHHALELIMKDFFNLSVKGHLLIPLLAKVSDQEKISQFSERDHFIIQYSDQINSDDGQLRYEKGVHKQFDWDIFYELVLLAKRLIEKKVSM